MSSTLPAILHTISDVKQWRRSVLKDHESSRIGFVPTMGALHDGHLSLARLAKAQRSEQSSGGGGCTHVILSIFVNPTQFGNEDFDRYPRTADADIARCRAATMRVTEGDAEEREEEISVIDAVWLPSVQDMYPNGSPTFSAVCPSSLLGGGHPPALHLEGLSRRALIPGVMTVCTKLFNIVQPDVAVFGAKDSYQCGIIAKMVEDLNLPLELKFAPVARDPASGLALSSRNAYLTEHERTVIAPTIYSAIKAAIRSEVDRVGGGDASRLVDAAALLSHVQSFIEVRLAQASTTSASLPSDDREEQRRPSPLAPPPQLLYVEVHTWPTMDRLTAPHVAESILQSLSESERSHGLAVASGNTAISGLASSSSSKNWCVSVGVQVGSARLLDAVVVGDVA